MKGFFYIQNLPTLENSNSFVERIINVGKVIYDKKLDFLHMTPGAAGAHGFHKVCTAQRFVIDGKNIRDLEIWEIPRNEAILKV